MNEEQEWRDLPSILCVAKVQADGWEIEWRDPLNYPHWEPWDGKGWSVRWQFRGRPRQPKMKEVKMECFLISNELVWRNENQSVLSLWIRQPHLDLIAKVPE